jgi:hypothetical protein
VRSLEHPDFGMPSGHCSSTVAFWGMLAVLFRKKALNTLAILLAVLMPLSRMYLGRHFLGDTVGGLLLGLVALFIAGFVVPNALRTADRAPASRKKIAETIIMIVLPVLPMFFGLTRTYASPLLALGLVYFASGKLAVFDANRTVLSRAIITVVGLIVVVSVLILLKDLAPKWVGYGTTIIAVFGIPAVGLMLNARRTLFLSYFSTWYMPTRPDSRSLHRCPLTT